MRSRAVPELVKRPRVLVILAGATTTSVSTPTNTATSNCSRQNLLNTLQDGGHVMSDDATKKTICKTIMKHIIPHVKFLHPSLLNHDGPIAKQLKMKIKSYRDLPIDGDAWRSEWYELIKQMITAEVSRYRAQKAQHVFRSIASESKTH